MNILSICDVPDVLRVVKIVVTIIKIIRIVVPIILILFCMIDGVKATMSGDLENMKKTLISRMIAALLIFLMPTFVNFVVKSVAPNSDYNKCINNATSGKIAASYEETTEYLVSKAERTNTINDYYTALIYLNNIKDPAKRAAFLERLNVVKEKIEASRPKDGGGGGGYPSTTYGKCTFKEYNHAKTSNTLNVKYGVCVPENYQKTGIPMIVWLHGSGEVGVGMTTLRHSGLPTVIENWTTTGLKEIPAIVVAPILPSSISYSDSRYIKSVSEIMDSVIKEYNVNTNNVSLIGHSLGGSGVYHVGSGLKDRFKAVVVLSGYISSPSGANLEWWKQIPLKGYSESGTKTKAFLTACGKASEYRLLNVSHGGVPKAAAIIDDNKDGISDMFYFMLSQGGSYPEPIKEEGKTAPKCEKRDKYQLCSPQKGVFGSFPYYDKNPSSTADKWSLEMDPVWKEKNLTTVITICNSGLNLKWTVHVNAKEKFKSAQEKMCQLTTTGIDGIKYNPSQLTDSGSLAIRFIADSKNVSLHSYGVAVDYNYDYAVTVNGRTYKPYQRNVNEYNAFISALGKENDSRNVNYILWKKVFEPLGFEWGGFWGRNGDKNTFDGCHFEVKY